MADAEDLKSQVGSPDLPRGKAGEMGISGLTGCDDNQASARYGSSHDRFSGFGLHHHKRLQEHLVSGESPATTNECAHRSERFGEIEFRRCL